MAVLRLPVTPGQAQWARWRVWAAETRDRYSGEVSENARLLARLLDCWAEEDRMARRPHSPGNLTESLDEAILQLVGWLVLSGVSPSSLGGGGPSP